jgi:predicted oxidoreductase (fatty acid repression mutant protein)
MAKLNNDANNAKIKADATKYAADRKADSEVKDKFPLSNYFPIPLETKDGVVKLQINKNTWQNYANGEIQNLISKYFTKTDASLLDIIKGDEPTKAWEAIKYLLDSAVPFGKGSGTDATMFKEGRTKEQLQKDIDKLLWRLNEDDSLSNPYEGDPIEITTEKIDEFRKNNPTKMFFSDDHIKGILSGKVGNQSGPATTETLE